MAQETFTDVQPIQQAKPEQFTDVQPIQKPAPSTPISSEEQQRYALTYPKAENLPGVQKPSPESAQNSSSCTREPSYRRRKSDSQN